MQYAAIIRVIVEIFPLVSRYCLKFCTGFGLVRVKRDIDAAYPLYVSRLKLIFKKTCLAAFTTCPPILSLTFWPH